MIHNTHKGLMGMKRTHASDAWRVAAFLALSGGFQDAYSFLARGYVFANAQTGNIVLFGTKVFALDIAGAIHYLLPVISSARDGVHVGGARGIFPASSFGYFALAAGSSYRRSCTSVRSWFHPVQFRLRGQRHRFVYMRDAGTGVPQDTWQCLLQHDVHR